MDQATAAGTPGFLDGGGELGALMRATDWSATVLGAPEGWPQSLKTAIRIMLTSRQPIWIGWGRDLLFFYNDAYRSIIGGKHPDALGQPTAVVWREIWADIEPLLATALSGVEGTYVEEQLLVMERNGYPEETYYTFSYSPIPDDDGTPGGIICANTDDTHRVVGERQLALLRELAARTIDARTVADACARSLAALATNPRDLTFALLYLGTADGRRLTLAGATGIEAGHPAGPAEMAADGSGPWALDEAGRSAGTRVLADLTGRFGTDLPGGGWPQPTSRAALLPILPSGETGRSGVLIVGLNPVRLFDEDYRGFLELAAGQVAAAIGSAEAYEDERRRAEALAEIDRAKTIFFSNVSHEFRTPLTLMLGPLEDLLARAGTGPEAAADRAMLEVASRNAHRLLKLVNALLDFSRIEAGRVQTAFEPVDLGTLTADLAATFRSAMERAGLAFTVTAEPLPAPVHVDREMWEKVVLNLLSNAFKFTLDGAVAVTVRPGADGAMAEVTVRDTGIGIPRRNCRASSTASTGSKAPTAGPSKAAASASRSSTNSSACTAAPWPWRAPPDGAPPSPCACPTAPTIFRRTGSPAAGHATTAASTARSTWRRRCAGCRTRTPMPAIRPSGTRRTKRCRPRHRARGSSSPTTTPTCAPTSSGFWHRPAMRWTPSPTGRRRSPRRAGGRPTWWSPT